MRNIETILIGLLLLMFVSCSESNNFIQTETIVGSGNPVTNNLTLASFNSIDLKIVGTVNIASGLTQMGSFTVDDNIAPRILFEVNNGELTIASPTNVHIEDYELTVNLTMTDLENLTISGVGAINSVNSFAADTVTLDLFGVGSFDMDLSVAKLTSILEGVGTISLNGSAGWHACINSGVGTILGYGLDTDTAVVTNTGPGNIQVTVNDSLNATITSSGSIYYKGNPVIESLITGTGNLIDAN